MGKHISHNMKIGLTFLLVLLWSNSIHAQNTQNIVSDQGIIHFNTFGEGEPILIINGGPGMHSEGFIPMAKILGKTNTTIIYDQRGTGKSILNTVNSNTITLDLMVKDIEIIREHLNIDKWVVLGHSFGGMLASYYTANFPEKTKGLILSSSGGIDMELFSTLSLSSRLTVDQRDSLKYWNTKIANNDTTYYARLQRGKHLAPAYLYDKSNVPIVAQRLTEGNPKVNGLVYENMRKINFDCAQKLRQFTNPVLIIQGEQDIIGKDIADKANAVFKNSKIVILKKCGHYGWLDQPEHYFKEITSFLGLLES